MGWPVCNTTLEKEKIEEDPLWQGFTFHRFGLIISAVFALIAVVMSGYLVFRHCTHYLKPWEQRHIIRVLFMVPIYAAVSFLSFYFYQHSVYYAVLRDCYEAFAIASFFALLCHYIAPDLHSQKDYFRGLKPRSWVLPLNWFKKCCGGEHGIWRTPRSGLTWFNIIWLGVFQYCFIRVATTLVALVTQLAGRYCLESLNPAFAHIWVMVIEGACVTVAMYCLIQFYIQLRQDLSEHRPFLKILAIKLVIFLSFWQTLLISFLTSSGTIKSSRQLATPDIKIGIPSMLLCIEMALFSILHLFAFPWKEYDIHRSPIVAAESGPSFLPDKSSYKGGPLGIHALLDAFNPWDLIKAVVRGFRWLFVGRHKRELDVSYRDGTHLDSTRTGGAAADPAYRASMRGKASRYQPLGDEDDEQLLAYPPSNPVASDPYRPGRPNAAPVGTMGDSGDIGRARRYEYSDGADRLGAMHSAPDSAGRSRNDYAGQESGVIPAPLTQDTGYHGAMGGSVPRPGADGTGAGPGGQWDMWAGAAAHGVRPGEHDPSNRF